MCDRRFACHPRPSPGPTLLPALLLTACAVANYSGRLCRAGSVPGRRRMAARWPTEVVDLFLTMPRSGNWSRRLQHNSIWDRLGAASEAAPIPIQLRTSFQRDRSGPASLPRAHPQPVR